MAQIPAAAGVSGQESSVKPVESEWLRRSMQLLKDVAQRVLFWSGALRVMESVLGRVRREKGVRVFFCHHVAPEDAEAFGRALRYLKRRYEVLALEDAVERLSGNGELRREVAVITFDDGYADNYENALPILRELGIPATFFISTGAVEQRERLWFDQVREWVMRSCKARIELDWVEGPLGTAQERRRMADAAVERLKAVSEEQRVRRMSELSAHLRAPNSRAVPRNRMLSPGQLQEMAAMEDITIGAHTRSHPILPRTRTARAWAEILGSMRDVQRMTGQRPRFFAYPNGSWSERDRTLVAKAGFVGALTTSPGVDYAGDDLYTLHRQALPLGPVHSVAWQVSGIRESWQCIVGAARRLRARIGASAAPGQATKARETWATGRHPH